MSAEQSSLFLSHADVSFLMMVFNDNENDKNDKSKNDNNNNHNKKLRSRGTNNMHEVILRGNRYILFANLLATHRKFFPSRLIKDFFIKKSLFCRSS